MSTKTQTQKASSTKATRKSNKSNNQALLNGAEQVEKVVKNVFHLKEGVTGKQRLQARSKTNKQIKQMRADYNKALTEIFTPGSVWVDQVDMSKTAFKKLYTPRDIKNQMNLQELEWAINSLRDTKKRGWINFTPTLIMSCYDRKGIKQQAPNNYAVQFFDMYEGENFDVNKFTALCNRILKARAKQLAENKAKKQAKESKK